MSRSLLFSVGCLLALCGYSRANVISFSRRGLRYTPYHSPEANAETFSGTKRRFNRRKQAEVPVDDLRADEDPEDGSKGKVGAEGDAP